MGQGHPTVELPGHGAAPDWDVTQDYLTQACELAARELSGPTHIVGHSFGGAVALRLAIEKPAMVRSLTLIEPVFFKAAFEANPKSKRAYTEQAEPFRDAMAALDFTTAAKSFSEHWNDMPWDMMRPEQQQYVIDRLPLIAAAEPSISEDNAGLWPRLKAFERPVLLLEGARSPAMIADIQQGLLSQLPNAQRQIVEGAGHMGPISHPKPFADAILAFQQGH